MKPGLHIDGIDARFLVHGRMEILALLNELIYYSEPVSVHFGVDECMETRLLEAREHALVFEAGRDAQANARLAAASACTFSARPQGIQVLFAAERVEPLRWGDSAAFSVALPTKLARLQRQENVRTIVPSQQPTAVALYAGDGKLLGEWPLRDLSVGGLGVALPTPDELRRAASAVRARLDIAGHAVVDCAVSVRHATDLAQSEDESGYRIGLGFIDLPEPVRVAILRYIVDIERERRGASPSHQAED
ncbi:c-di-GMP-binding flagellar brake protein YcgR [Paucimonas lemoignei]|uniref:C-di-GMP-binding flagellar brake protein YcgR n=1 Tax=Paucimonas lemoignei TaxID=29443 RepID=A0A4R3HX18_PAULE|nr:flagellar brake protein [Paucimonas lemoignei]TCS37846.1 c-di-GMP-binding flagellar brake protein YcgR [Paucimonas lemoignei]